jgi:hypothetical protein
MTSKRFVTGAVLVGVLSTTPVFAQHARARGEQSGGGDRGGDRGGSRADRGGDRGGNRGGESRVYRSPDRAPQQRSYDSGRRYDAPRQRNEAPRTYQAPRQYDSGRRATAPRTYQAPRVYQAPRSYQYDRRTNRSYDYNRGYRGGYVAPRRDPYNRSYRSYGPAYRNTYRSYRPYYGYRGVYGYGGSYRSSRILGWVPWRPYHYRPRFSIGVYYGAGGYYNYGYTPSYYYDPIPGREYGGVRITNAPREAQVFADGYYVGIVDDFDGVFQHVNLEAGQHRIEVRVPGYDDSTVSFDVYVQPGRTITLRADAYDDGYVDSDY